MKTYSETILSWHLIRHVTSVTTVILNGNLCFSPNHIQPQVYAEWGLFLNLLKIKDMEKRYLSPLQVYYKWSMNGNLLKCKEKRQKLKKKKKKAMYNLIRCHRKRCSMTNSLAYISIFNSLRIKKLTILVSSKICGTKSRSEDSD